MEVNACAAHMIQIKFQKLKIHHLTPLVFKRLKSNPDTTICSLTGNYITIRAVGGHIGTNKIGLPSR